MSSAALRVDPAALVHSLAEADAILAELQAPHDLLSAPYWAIHNRLVAATRPDVMQHNEAAKLERRKMYDEHQQASASLWPVKKKFKEVTAWRKAVVRDFERVNGELAALPPARIGLLSGPPCDPFQRAKAAWMAVRGLTAAPPVAARSAW